MFACLALSGDAFSNMCNSILRQNYHYINQYLIYLQMDIAQDLILYKRILNGSLTQTVHPLTQTKFTQT